MLFLINYHVFQYKYFNGRKEYEDLKDFILKEKQTEVIPIDSAEIWEQKKVLSAHWLLYLQDYHAESELPSILDSLLVSCNYLSFIFI